MPTAFDRRTLTAAAALAAVFLLVYLATFSGQLHSIDELALFGMTERLAQGGGFTPTLTRFAVFHNPVGALEPGYPLLAVPFYLAARNWTGISNLHAVLLLNPLLTALTAGALVVLARQLRYALPQALAAGVMFGLGSMAWPYTKSFLREPAVALLLTVSAMGLAAYLHQPSWRTALWALLPLLVAPGVKLSTLAIWSVGLAGVAWRLFGARRLRWPGLIVSVGVGVVSVVALGLWLFPQRGIDLWGMLTGFILHPLDAAMWTPIYGLLLSPGKSLFIYTPALLLSILGALPFARRHPALAASIGLALVTTLLSLRYSMWWGGLTWGPRFLLPLLPLLVLPALEVLQRPWAWLLVLVSIAYQAAAALIDWSKIYAQAADHYADNTIGLQWLHWADSPGLQVIGRWRPQWLDMLWWYPTSDGWFHDGKWAWGLVLVLILAAGALIWTLRGRAQGVLLAWGLALVLMPLTVWRAGRNLPDYADLTAATARQLAATVTQSPYAPQNMLYVSSDIGTYPWLGFLKGSVRTTWVSPAETSATLDEALVPSGHGARVAVVVDRPHIASLYPGDELTTWLTLRAYRLASEWQSGFEVFYFAADPDPVTETAAAAAWPTGVRLTALAVPVALARGQALPVRLSFTCERDDWTTTDQLFVNLIGPDGTVVAGQQGELQYGHLASLHWQAGQTAQDRRGLWLPADIPPGSYTLLVGFSNGSGFVPATLPGGESVDYVSATTVTITP